MKAAIYTRVSTAKQNTDRQLAELQEYASRQGMDVVLVKSETVSGTKKKIERPGLEEVFNLARRGEISEVLTLELSRLGRNAQDVRQIILDLAELGVCVHVVNKNLKSLDKHRKKDSITMMILGILADLAEMEKETLTERILSGLAEARKQGRVGGRKEGYKKPEAALLRENKKAADYLKAGRSIREVAKLCDLSPNTVMKVKRAMVTPE